MKPNPEKGGKWGILGGTFDPVHFGHLTLAQEVSRHKKLDGVLFIPSVNHPFKKGTCIADYSDRVEMLHRAVDDRPQFHVCEIEAEQDLSGFTLDTVRALKEKYPAAEFYFIVGADLLKELRKWHRVEELLEEVKILVGSRPFFRDPTASKNLPKGIEPVPTAAVDVSSTHIRTMLRRGASPDTLLKFMPLKVINYIFEQGLYR